MRRTLESANICLVRSAAQGKVFFKINSIITKFQHISIVSLNLKANRDPTGYPDSDPSFLKISILRSMGLLNAKYVAAYTQAIDTSKTIIFLIISSVVHLIPSWRARLPIEMYVCNFQVPSIVLEKCAATKSIYKYISYGYFW